MKLLDLIPSLKNYARIKRKNWNNFIVKSEDNYRPLIKCDFACLILREYALTYDDLMADDWEILE